VAAFVRSTVGVIIVVINNTLVMLKKVAHSLSY
jgi:hypothetical protein